MATRADIVRLAHRRLGVLSSDEALTAEQLEFGGDILDALFSELPYTQGTSFAWALSATPSQYLIPLAYLLATEPAFIEHYATQAVERRSAAVARLRAIAFPDDRATRADINDDGTVTTAESDADLRAQFY